MRSLFLACALVACSGADAPLDDGGTDAGVDHVGTPLDASDASPTIDAKDVACTALGPTDGGAVKACEPLDDSFCGAAAACGDSVHTNHYRCDNGSSPYHDPLGIDYHCLDFGGGDFCCTRRDCIMAYGHAPSCDVSKSQIACWGGTSPGDAGTACTPGAGDVGGDQFFCCDAFTPSP